MTIGETQFNFINQFSDYDTYRPFRGRFLQALRIGF